MTNPARTAEENLSFLRSLAEAGQDAPLMAGPYLIAGGAWFGLASLLHWLFDIGALAAPAMAHLYTWVGAAAGFALTLTMLIRRDRHRTENSSNRAINAAWTAVGMGIFCFWISLFIVSSRSGNPFVWVTMPLIVLTVYGIAWRIAGALTGKRWMHVTTGLTFASVIVTAYLHDTAHLFLVYAACLVLTAVVPGYVMLSESRARTG